MGEMLAGRYELIDLIDSGGSGAVWRIWDHRTGALRAGKILRQGDADALLRFVRETSRRIEHSHVVAPDGWYGEDGRVMLTMPLVGGGSLATLMRDFGPLPLGWGIEVLRQLLQALTAVHDVGLVHRDVKPANLLLEPTGRGRPHLRLADFGTAAAVDAPRLTQVGYVIGTPGFMAPEQARGADPDPRQDLYAAGVTVVLALTGQHAEREGPPRLDVPPFTGPTGQPLAELLAALLATDPRQRPAGAREALGLLAAIPGADDFELGADPADPVEVFDQLQPLPEGYGRSTPAPQAPTSTLPPAGDQAVTPPPGVTPPPPGVTPPLPGVAATVAEPVQVFPEAHPAWADPFTAEQSRWQPPQGDPVFVPPAWPAEQTEPDGRPTEPAPLAKAEAPGGRRVPVVAWVLLGFGVLCLLGAGVALALG